MSEKLKHLMESEPLRVVAVATSSVGVTCLSFLDLVLKVVIGVLTIIYLVRKLQNQKRPGQPGETSDDPDDSPE